VWKVTTTIKTNYEKVKKIIDDPVYAHRNDRLVSIIKRIDKGSDTNNREFYVRSVGFFPIASRDMVFARHDYWGEREGHFVAYSIVKEDFPKFPKVVRSEIIVSGIKLVANEANDEVKLTYISK
jgi:hypothetical protein